MANGRIYVEFDDGSVIDEGVIVSDESRIFYELIQRVLKIKATHSKLNKKEKNLVLAETIHRGKMIVENNFGCKILKQTSFEIETDKVKYYFYTSDIVNQTRGMIYDKIYVQKELMFNHEVIDTIIPLVNFDIDKIQIV